MPRYANNDSHGSTQVADFCTKTGNGSSTFDLCRRCGLDAEGEPLAAYNLSPYNGEPAGVLTNVEWHPDYDENDYVCECCGKPLTARDD